MTLLLAAITEPIIGSTKIKATKTHRVTVSRVSVPSKFFTNAFSIKIGPKLIAVYNE
jgi:hypothetical protein